MTASPRRPPPPGRTTAERSRSSDCSISQPQQRGESPAAGEPRSVRTARRARAAGGRRIRAADKGVLACDHSDQVYSSSSRPHLCADRARAVQQLENFPAPGLAMKDRQQRRVPSHRARPRGAEPASSIVAHSAISRRRDMVDRDSAALARSSPLRISQRADAPVAASGPQPCEQRRQWSTGAAAATSGSRPAAASVAVIGANPRGALGGGGGAANEAGACDAPGSSDAGGGPGGGGAA